jgi:serine incorporator 1/3
VEEGKGKKEEKEARPVSYSYSFFHLIFALASMYSAMLLSGWTSTSESSDLGSDWHRMGYCWVVSVESLGSFVVS